MNQLNKRIGKILRDHREIKQITQLDLAKKLGYDSSQFVSLFERGLSKCPTKVIGKICKILDIDPEVFLKIIIDDLKAKNKKELGIK